MTEVDCVDVLKDFTDKSISDYQKNNKELNHEQIANEFMELFSICSEEELCNILACTGFIPDLYPADSSEETLFSKLVEALVAVWAIKMGFKSILIKEKSSYEDINIIIDNNVIVCDAKSFRLGRSQAAPNPKDFLKLEDIRKWLKRHKKGLGGLVTYPNTHDWKRGGDTYLYCTTKDCPTLMLSYIHLAVLLHFKKHYKTSDLVSLWDYQRLFPHRIEKKIPGGNRVPYWNTIHNEMVSIMGIELSELENKLSYYEKIQQAFIIKKVKQLEKIKDETITKTKGEINKMPDDVVRNNFIEYKIYAETEKIDKCIERIKNFRLNGGD